MQRLRIYMTHAKRALAVRKYKEAGELTHSVARRKNPLAFALI